MKLHKISAACGLLLSLSAGAAIAQSDAADEARAASEADRARQAQQRANEAATRAQGAAERAVAMAQAGEHVRIMAQDMNFAAREMGQERVVKGAPYCADATHETIQPLADGNRIYRKQNSRLCRDGEGRTRQEVEHNGKRTVYVNDPVAKENWILNPDTKTAINLQMAFKTNVHFNFGDGASWSGVGERVGERVREITRRIGSDGGTPRPPAVPAPHAQPAPPVPPAPALIKETESTDEKGRVRRDVEVRVIRVGDADKAVTFTAPMAPMPPMAAMPAIPANVQLRALSLAPRGPGALTSLGSKEIEGVKVNGERTTWTVEAGKQGNEKPMVTTREVWTSPELMLTVSSRDFDPRTGEVTYKLSNIKRGEPDANLFKVPADYEKARTPAPKPASKG